MPPPSRLTPATSALLVIDMQERLLPRIPAAAQVIKNIAFMLDAAGLAGVQTCATEQYPKGLGATTPELARRLPERPAKLAFSSCAVPGLVEGLRGAGRTHLLLAGIETHVCVLNTGLDLLADGWQVHIAVDAVASRFTVDHDTALKRLERAGAILTTVETAGFEWMGGAEHPRFKDFSALVQGRVK